MIAVAAGGFTWWRSSKSKSAAAGTVQQRLSRVRQGNLVTTVTGSGPITFTNNMDAVSKAAGTITKVYHKQGDQVKAGELLFELDDADAVLNVEKAQNSISQMQLTQNSNVVSLNGLTVTAPFSGQVTGIQVKSGTTANKGDVFMTLTDTSKMKVTVPVNDKNGKNISVGQSATINLPDVMQSVNGTVTYVSSAANTSNSSQLYSVEISFDNQGTLKEGMKASAEISAAASKISSADYGTLSYANKTTIRSANSGTVTSVPVKENQFVLSGALLVGMQNDDLVSQKQTTDLKMQDLQAQLENAQKQLTYYKVFAPISGTIVTQTKIVGNSVKAEEALSSIADTTQAAFTIPVDELDISKLQVGQKADITIDALPDTSSKPVSGKVAQIDPLGNSSNGVTTYNVSVALDSADKVKSGMNANATVYVSTKNDVLMVPLEAVTKIMGKNYVMVKGDPNTVAEMKKNGTYTNIFRQRGTGQNSGQGGNGSFGGGFGGGNGSGNRSNSGSGARNNSGSTNRSSNSSGNRSGNSGSGGNNASFGGGNGGGFAFGGNKNNAASQTSTYYSDAIPKEVQIGTNNEDYIEIISGVQEGDELILPPLTNSQSGGTGAAIGAMGAAGGMGATRNAGGARTFGGGGN